MGASGDRAHIGKKKMLNKSQKDLIELQLEELQKFILHTTKYIMEWKRGQGEQSRKNGSQIEYLTVLRT